MTGELAARVIAGRVLTGGAAQTVTRRPGMVQIVLTCMPGHPAAAAGEDETVAVAFAEPVPVQAGDRVAVVIDWAAGSRDYAGPVWMPCATVLPCAHIRR